MRVFLSSGLDHILIFFFNSKGTTNEMAVSKPHGTRRVQRVSCVFSFLPNECLSCSQTLPSPPSSRPSGIVSKVLCSLVDWVLPRRACWWSSGPFFVGSTRLPFQQMEKGDLGYFPWGRWDRGKSIKTMACLLMALEPPTKTGQELGRCC